MRETQKASLGRLFDHAGRYSATPEKVLFFSRNHPANLLGPDALLESTSRQRNPAHSLACDSPTPPSGLSRYSPSPF